MLGILLALSTLILDLFSDHLALRYQQTTEVRNNKLILLSNQSVRCPELEEENLHQPETGFRGVRVARIRN